MSQYKDDKQHGDYFTIYDNGNVEEGSCIDGLQDGMCVLTRPDGSIKTELWEEGKIA